jgi:restriction system protein
LDLIYVQAKRWTGTVAGQKFRNSLGRLQEREQRRGRVHYSLLVYGRSESLPCGRYEGSLIDGEDLAQYMIDFNLGVSLVRTYEVKRIDNDYFEED